MHLDIQFTFLNITNILLMFTISCTMLLHLDDKLFCFDLSCDWNMNIIICLCIYVFVTTYVTNIIYKFILCFMNVICLLVEKLWIYESILFSGLCFIQSNRLTFDNVVLLVVQFYLMHDALRHTTYNCICYFTFCSKFL